MSSCKSCGDVAQGIEGTQEINSSGSVPLEYYPVPPSSCPQPPPLQPTCVTPITPPNRNCGCSGCVTQSGCCSNLVQAQPQPFYAQSSMCQENHTKTIVNNNFATAIKVATSFNMPACGASAILSFPGLSSVVIGGYIWNPTYGYLKILALNTSNSQLTVQNDCTTGNAPVGTAVPACTYFDVTTPPVSSGGGSGGAPSVFPYLAVDFTAPIVGACINITLTNVNGLSVGKNVQIAGGTYRLSAIIDSTTVTICNDGAGVTPNTPVLALNAANEFQYPVVLIDTNACTNSPAVQGSILVCNAGISQALDATALGQVPVVVDATTNEVQFQTLDVPVRTCATLTACLTLVPGQASYILTVSSSAQFVVGDLLQIGTRTDRFTVTAIIDATHIQGTLDPIPGAVVDIAPGVSVCIADCCEILQLQIDTINTELEDLESSVRAAQANMFGPANLNAGNTNAQTFQASVTFNNPNPSKVGFGYFSVDSVFIAQADNTNTNFLAYDYRLLIGIDVPPVAVLGGVDSIQYNDNAAYPVSKLRTYSGVFSVPVSGSTTINAIAEVNWVGNGTAQLNISDMNVRIHGIMVAV